MNQLTWLRLLAALLAILLIGCGAPPVDSIAIGPESQLFVDDRLVSEAHGVRRTLHPAQKLAQPVLVADRPWEGERVYVYGTIYHDPAEEIFKMWYLARLGPGYEKRLPGLGEHGDLVLYATSKDGVQWEKPNLNLHQFDGSGDNNIVLLNLHSPAILIDADAPDTARYRMLAWNWDPEHYGYWRAYSDDGIVWKEYKEGPVLFKPDEILEAMTTARSPKDGAYLAFFRLWDDVRGFHRRAIGVSRSEDFQHWSAPQLVLTPDEEDDKWASGTEQRTEFYNMAAFSYGSQFLGFLPVFRVERILKLDKSVSASNQAKWDGPIDAQLVHSRDGVNWERFEDRSPLIPNGEPGSFDAGCILALANPPVIAGDGAGDEVWVYYTAVNTKHGAPMPPKRITIARASWRLDGFVSLDSDNSGGIVETVTLQTAGDQLEVNVDASKGSLQVEVLSAAGEVLPEFDLESSERISGNQIRHIVRWNERSLLDTAEPIRLRFHLNNAQLYSFRITKHAVAA